MEGWIRIHRKIKDHWLWKSERRLKWWLDILLTVNHTDSKILIGNTLIECKRGQSIRSLDTWAKEWNVTKGAVRDFFKLLESDGMLYTESLRFTTRITVCNYDNYQDLLNAKISKTIRKGNGEETQSIPKQEGEKEIKNEKNIIPPPLELVIKYCKERNSPIDPQYFHDWNTARGWKLKDGKLIIDWQATIRTWEQRDKANNITRSEKLMLP